MKVQIFSLISLLLLTLAVPAALGIYIAGEDTIVKQSKESVLIVAGTITGVQYVQPDMSKFRVYTDVTMEVSKTLKGEPNINDETVRFRIGGGVGIHPMDGEVYEYHISDNMEFAIGDKMILFIVKRTWGLGWPFYDGLYPKMYPYPPQIVDAQVNGQTQTVAQFRLGFFNERYTMNLPVETAFRFIEAAVKAPDEISLLEEKIRPIQASTMERLQNPPAIESPNFLGMLNEELATIEALIKEREAQNEEQDSNIDR